MKRAAFIVLGFILICIFFFLTIKQKNKVDKFGLEDVNLNFSGIVTDIHEVNGYNGYGIITLNIISSNVKEYDPRNSIEFYYCIIKHGVAEVYGHTSNRMLGRTMLAIRKFFWFLFNPYSLI